MAESDMNSRKRIRLSSSLSQTPSITESQNHIPSNRSGKIHSAVCRAGNELTCEKLDRKAPFRVYPRITIKDLRLKRVFSPASFSNDWEFHGKGKESLSDSQNPNVVKEGSKDNIDRLIDSAEDREVATTPPDSEQFSGDAVSTQDTIVNLVNGLSEKKSDTNLRTKSVFHPFSRAKIFKNPGSFSYKRLLPYLMEAAYDAKSSGRSLKPEKSFGKGHLNTGSKIKTEIGKTRNVGTQDLKKEVGEMMTVKDQCAETKQVSESGNGVFCKPLSQQHPVQTTASSPNKKSVCSKHKLFRTPGSVNYRRLLPYLRGIPEENHLLPVFGKGAQGADMSDVSESVELSDPDKEQETQVKHVILNTEKQVDSPSSRPDSRCSGDVATSVSVDALEEAKNSCIENKKKGAENLEDEKMGEKPGANGLNSWKGLVLEASIVSSGTLPPPKGILKRNGRGCIGSCACLNCSSFRLHAEREFKFSRNQFQDTEEMVLDLVGEMSYLRDMLEKQHAASAGHAPSQVEEACRRASMAAEVAKSRLHEMKDDLQVHCRIP